MKEGQISEPIADRLSIWSIPAALHYGSRDSQTPPNFEATLALDRLNDDITVRIHKDLGHSLGDHVLLGPISDEALAAIVSDAILLIEACD